MKLCIVWLRQDLRLEDNSALVHATQAADAILPVYIFDTSVPKLSSIGGAQRWWLHHSLAALEKQFAKLHAPLILRRGDPEKILLDLIKETQAEAIYWNRCYEAYAIKRDSHLKNLFKELDIETKSFNSALLFEPWEITNQQNQYFKVFTPFWKTCLKQPEPKLPLPIPTLKSIKFKIKSDALDAWKLLPSKPNWAQGFSKFWQPGSAGAQQRLEDFLENRLQVYAHHRDIPSLDSTSRLSPHLHFGEISPRQIWHAVQRELVHRRNISKDTERFLAELGWREFSYHVLYHFPKLPTEPVRSEFAAFAWQQNRAAMHAWEQGQTGYPIIDAGMRQLWQIGWMHNRVRMIVASFLIKDLLIPWQKGTEWFWDTLVDADLANNSASWQWVAGCGYDAAPYFRIFNPTLQSKKFDPEGKYVRQWVPELSKLPNKYIHEPWTAPTEILKAAGIKLDHDYPKPIIDHHFAAKRALAEFKKLKQ